MTHTQQTFEADTRARAVVSVAGVGGVRGEGGAVTWRHLDLFSGIGGFGLAASWMGWETVAFCECEPFCQAVLRHHWPGVPIHDDIRTMPTEPYAGVDILTGGFPCQDLSLAGKQAGLAGERSGLWFDMLRVVRAARPRWVVVENVPGLLVNGVDVVLGGLEEAGYAVWPHAVAAADVGAPHRRLRLWIVGRRRDAGVGLADARCVHVQRWRGPRDVGGAARGVEDAAQQRERLRDAAGDGCAPELADAGHHARRRERDQQPHDQGEQAPGGDGAATTGAGDGQAVACCHGPQGQQPAGAAAGATERGGRDGLADPQERGERSRLCADEPGGEPRRRSGDGSGEATEGWPTERRLGRSPDGPADRLDGCAFRWPARPGEEQHEWEPPRLARGQRNRARRLRALGNSIVPQCAYAVFLAIEEADRAR